MAKRFGDFIGEARDSGKLASWIQNGITAFGELKDIAVNVWDIFKGIFKAQVGGDFLRTIVDITDKWTTWINSVEGQNSLKKFFDEAEKSLDEWWPILKDLGSALYNAFVGFKGAIDAALPILREITDLLARNPGLIQAAGAAFAAWQIGGILASVAKIGTALTGLVPTATASARRHWCIH